MLFFSLTIWWELINIQRQLWFLDCLVRVGLQPAIHHFPLHPFQLPFWILNIIEESCRWPQLTVISYIVRRIFLYTFMLFYIFVLSKFLKGLSAHCATKFQGSFLISNGLKNNLKDKKMRLIEWNTGRAWNSLHWLCAILHFLLI